MANPLINSGDAVLVVYTQHCAPRLRVQKIFVSFALFVFKITRVQNPLSEICVQ